MFTVKCKYFADANFNKFLNIRKFFAIFLKKSSPSPQYCPKRFQEKMKKEVMLRQKFLP